MKKTEALKILFLSAEQYQKNLENRNLLLICTNAGMNKIIAIKMQFESKNFMHLTGVKFQEGKRLPSDTFYMRCLSKRLSINDEKYSEIVYKAKKVNWTKIKFPKEYEYLRKPENYNDSST
ncbi:MAG: PBECR4 domain-containing protein [Clostridiales bacterium]|nr:PBECR4 domain-containing protein [Clostridiales bacterium]